MTFSVSVLCIVLLCFLVPQPYKIRAVWEASTICLRPLQVDLLTLNMVSVPSHVWCGLPLWQF